MSRIIRKPVLYICENTGTDQQCSNCGDDQHLCFRFTERILVNPLLYSVDVDECLYQESSDCNGNCINIPGSYRCECDEPGFRTSDDNKTCIGIYFRLLCSLFLSSPNVERTVFRTINVIIMKEITTHNIYKYIYIYLPIITD